MFGSLGWGLAMFIVGIALDHSTAFPDYPCDPDPKEKNYTICFAIFSVLMGVALITATQIIFKYDFPATEEPVSSSFQLHSIYLIDHSFFDSSQEVDNKPPAELTREEQLQSQLSQQLNLPGLQTSIDPKPPQPPEEKVTSLFIIFPLRH